MHLVLGLGNPGDRYARTRHNVAWRVLDVLAERWKAIPGERTATYRGRRAEVSGKQVQLVVPLTFMNLSGEAIRDWRERYPLETDALLVVSDDVYLPLGVLRLRAVGSSGGHRGLESIEAALESRSYTRLRVGVGAAGNAAQLSEWVLEEFAPEEEPALDEAVRRAADAVECWVSEGTLAAMNRFNRRTSGEVSES